MLNYGGLWKYIFGHFQNILYASARSYWDERLSYIFLKLFV